MPLAPTALALTLLLAPAHEKGSGAEEGSGDEKGSRAEKGSGAFSAAEKAPDPFSSRDPFSSPDPFSSCGADFAPGSDAPDARPSARRHLTLACTALLGHEGAAPPDSEWSTLYAAGCAANRRADPSPASELALCRALEKSAISPASSWWFAETLDELGLFHYQRGHAAAAEVAQGAAVAELLLARGPDEPNVAAYVSRLGIVLEWQGRGELHASLEAAPWRIFEQGYVPLDRILRARLGWLIAAYEKRSDLAAANALRELPLEGNTLTAGISR